jgi:hypothetical protein
MLIGIVQQIYGDYMVIIEHHEMLVIKVIQYRQIEVDFLE